MYCESKKPARPFLPKKHTWGWGVLEGIAEVRTSRLGFLFCEVYIAHAAVTAVEIAFIQLRCLVYVEVLSDAEKRERYDTTGCIDEEVWPTECASCMTSLILANPCPPHLMKSCFSFVG